jgi:hypothetical protein
MLKDLVTVANKLDSLGLSKEADFIDRVIEKHSMYHGDGYLRCDKCGRLYSEFRNMRMGGDDLCPPCAKEEVAKMPHHRRDSDSNLDDLG